jgi:hypothetical protein
VGHQVPGQGEVPHLYHSEVEVCRVGAEAEAEAEEEFTQAVRMVVRLITFRMLDDSAYLLAWTIDR